MTIRAEQNDRAARGKRILQHAVEHPNSIYAGHAVLAANGDPKQVEAAVLKVLNGGHNGHFGRIAAGTFDVFAAMHLACRWRDHLTPKTLDHIRRIMTTGVHHRGNTENHWLMYYTGNLLAAEFWPDVPQWWNGLTPAQMRDEAQRWLLGMIDRTARIGHHENTWRDVGTSATLIYYYFGIDREPNPIHLQPGMCPAVTAHFQPPEILTAIARDRTAPHTVKKTKAPRAIYRHVDRHAQPVRKTTYLSNSFALGATQTGLPGAPAGPIDLVSWDLTWPAAKHEGTIVCNHPYLGPGRFSAFLSENPRAIGRSVPTPKPYLQNPDRLFGASPYEQMMQHRNALIIGYQIPKDDAVASFDAFCDSVTKNPLDLSAWPTEGIICYRTLSSEALEFIYSGSHSVNRTPIDYTTWPLYEAPNIEAPLGTGIITFRHNGETHTLDFNVDPKREMIPMRVIG